MHDRNFPYWREVRHTQSLIPHSTCRAFRRQSSLPRAKSFRLILKTSWEGTPRALRIRVENGVFKERRCEESCVEPGKEDTRILKGCRALLSTVGQELIPRADGSEEQGSIQLADPIRCGMLAQTQSNTALTEHSVPPLHTKSPQRSTDTQKRGLCCL